jgi:hypothetical protein
MKLMIYEHDYMRAEFDWLASDRDGLVAYLSTAGAGPLPQEAIEVANQLDDLLSKIREMTPTGEAIPIGGVLNPRDWIDVAARGFYAYDWSFSHKRYELVAEPCFPRRVHEIPNAELRKLAERIRLPGRLPQSQYIVG